MIREYYNDELMPWRVVRSLRRRRGHAVVSDSSGTEMSGRTLLSRALAMRRILRREVIDHKDEQVGVLLPPSAGSIIVNLALGLDRRAAFNLNYANYSRQLNENLEAAGVRKVLTSRRFLANLDLQLDAQMVVLEDLKRSVRASDRLFSALETIAPTPMLERWLRLDKSKPDDLLAVIFTINRPGADKMVKLTHARVSQCIHAVKQLVQLDENDRVMCVLPFFDPLGLSFTLWGVIGLGLSAATTSTRLIRRPLERWSRIQSRRCCLPRRHISAAIDQA